jgi:nucleolar protein 16
MRSRDRNQTLLQNYKRLGLTSRLNAATGGTEKKITHNNNPATTNSDKQIPREDVDQLALPGSQAATKLIPTEARVERDPATGRILKVIRPESASQPTERSQNPLHDPLNSDSDSKPSSSPKPSSSAHLNPLIAALEAQAEAEAAQLAAKKRPRQQSKREAEWLAALVQRYGSDIAAMARDRRLNPMQQTEADIGRRVGVWRSGRGTCRDGCDVEI